MKRYLLIILFCCHPFWMVWAQRVSAERFFSTERLKTASYSIYAIDAESGAKICETAQKSLSTASVMKLMTTAVALEYLGPDFTFSTSLYLTGSVDTSTGTLNGNLILKGGGDPAFCSSFFEDHYSGCFDHWISQLKKRGIKRINGNLILDLSALDANRVPGGWCWDDLGNYYGASPSALTYADNLYAIHFASPKSQGMKTTIKFIEPEIKELNLENMVLSSTRSGDHTIVYGAPGSPNQVIEGTIPTEQTDFVVKAAMPDPPMIAGTTFWKKLKEEGIGFTGTITSASAEWNQSGTLIAIQLSPPLKELIVPLNKESLNLYAEHLLLEIGRRSSGKPSVDKGIEAYQQFCKGYGFDTLGFFPVDGSGLTRSNAFSAKTLVETMKVMYDGRNRDFFFRALPIAGVDGTLRNSFKDTPLEKNLQAKTGSMARVRSIAGLMKTKSKRTILFAILINNFDLTTAETSKLLESIIMSFYNDQK